MSTTRTKLGNRFFHESTILPLTKFQTTARLYRMATRGKCRIFHVLGYLEALIERL